MVGPAGRSSAKAPYMNQQCIQCVELFSRKVLFIERARSIHNRHHEISIHFILSAQSRTGFLTSTLGFDNQHDSVYHKVDE